MGKGLDIILDRIRTEPAPTLIARYMSLVQDLVDEHEKQARVLALALALTRSQPDEALRIAHEAYQSDPKNLESLEVMAAAFAAKGRFAKAAVLRFEKEKLERDQGKVRVPVEDLAAGPKMDLSETPPNLTFDRLNQEKNDRSDGLLARMAGLDLGDHNIENVFSGRRTIVAPPPGADFDMTLRVASESPPRETRVLDSARDASPHLMRQEKSADDGKGVSGSDEADKSALDAGKTPPGGLSRRLLKRLLGHEPGDTIFPFMSGAVPLNASTESPPATSNPPPSENSAPVDVGTPETPRRVHTPPFVSEARPKYPGQGLAKRPDFLVGRKFQFRPEFSQTEISVPTPKALPMWEALGPELARLKKRFPSRPLAEAHTAYLRQLFATHPKGAALPEEWIKALAELDHRLKGTDPSEILLLKWHLFQGLWGVAPTGACADLLKVLGLRHATPGFWGLYLDSLLADRRFRFALEDVRQTLIKHPHLNWARIGHIRLPLIWDGLMVHGFFWNEDQGVPALIAALSIRPRPKLSAILGNAFKPKRARP